MTAYLERTLEPGNLVVDIGAIAMPAGRLVGEKGRVFAIEAEKVNFEQLCGNIALNRLAQVEAHHLAIAAHSGTVVIHVYPRSNRGWHSIGRREGEGGAPLRTETVAYGAALLVAASFLRREIPPGVTEATRMFEVRSWLSAGGPLMLVGALQVASVQVPIILLGALADAEAVGLYAVAQRGAALINFILVSVSVPLAPVLASLHATGEVAKLQRVITASTRVVLLAALPFALFLLLYGRWFLALFGPEFAGGARGLP